MHAQHAPVPYAHAEGIQNEHFKNMRTDAHAENACKELMCMVRVSISSACAERSELAHKEFKITFKAPITAKINGFKSFTKKNSWPKLKKSPP
jgi:hypothetical protein